MVTYSNTAMVVSPTTSDLNLLSCAIRSGRPYLVGLLLHAVIYSPSNSLSNPRFRSLSMPKAPGSAGSGTGGATVLKRNQV
jgi:hypothetical protein